MNSRLGASPISSSQRFATPSPHRTGVPISDRFSIKRTSVPPRAAYFAAVLPVGPAPTTRTSTWRSICFGPIPSGLMRLWEDSIGTLGQRWKLRPRSIAGNKRLAIRGGGHGSNGVRIWWSSVLTWIMELETRKVQKLGYSSLGVSLPKDWASSNGIRPAALVSLAIEDDGSLRVRVGPLEEYPVAAEATIDADEWSGPEALTRMITGNYIVGCNTIRLRSREELSPSQLQEIHEAVRGLTIVNQGPKFVTIENFVEPTRFPIDGLLRRLHYLTSRMEKLALGVISGDAKGNIEEVGRMELEVDRLYWLVVRQLLLAAQNRTISGRIGVTEPRHLLGDRVVTVALENVGDLWEEVASGVGPVLKPNRRIPREFAKTVGNLKGKLEEVIELTMTAFFANDLGKANTALDHQAALIRDIRAAAESGPRSRSPPARGTPRSNGLFQLVLRPLEHVAKYYGSIAQITINRALERPARPRPTGAEPVPSADPTDRP